MDNIEVSGMVISSMPIGEYDRRLEILTADLGRISAFARGARKPSSSLVSVSRPFAFGEFSLYRGKNSYSLSGAKISNYFEDISKDVVKTYYGFYFLELACCFTREASPAKEELILLYQSLRALLSEKFDDRLVRAVYELKMVSLSGYAPDAEYIKSRRNLLSGTEYAYDFVLRTAPEKLYSFRLSEDVLSEFADLTKELIGLAADKEFNSLKLLETLL